MTEKIKYSFLIGLRKTVKNFLIIFGPAILAFLANVPIQYAAIAAFLAYLLKNWIENK